MAGYVRQDTTNNIADGNIINSVDLDNEYNAIEAAFNASTGHTHDGTSAEGAPITKVGPAQDVVVSATAVTPKTDNTVDLGSALLEFKDLYIDGTANIDSLVADTADINGGTIDGTIIGGASAAAGSFTTLAASGNSTIGGTLGVTGLITATGGVSGAVTSSNATVTGGSINGTTIGASTASTGAFTTLTSNSTTTLNGTTIPASVTLVSTAATQTLTNKTISGSNNTLSNIGNASLTNSSITFGSTAQALGSTVSALNGVSIGATTASTGAFTNLTTSGTVTHNGGTANGVAYLNGSKVLTTGSALTFDGTNLGIGALNTNALLTLSGDKTALRVERGSAIGFAYNTGTAATDSFRIQSNAGPVDIYTASGQPITFSAGAAEQMRLTSTGLGIGTSSPTNALSVIGNANITGNTTLGDATTDTVTVNGYMGVGGAPAASTVFRVVGSSTTGTSQVGIGSFPVVTSAATTASYGVYAAINGVAGAYTTTAAYTFRAGTALKGAGATITNAYGFYIDDQTQGTNNYGITSLVSSGANKWNIYASGTAANYFAGEVQIADKLSHFADTDTAVRFPAADTVSVETAGSERMRIDSAGNVGIGTSSPSAKLDVNGSKDATNLIIGAALSTVGGGAFANYSELLFKNTAGGNSDASIRAYGNVWNTAGSQLAFFTANNSAATERMRIDGAGNVGIGTSGPTSSGLTIGKQFGGVNLAGGGGTYAQWGGAYGIYPRAGIGLGLGSAVAISFEVNGGTEAARIDSSGNLLVGTTSGTQKLVVSGSVGEYAQRITAPSTSGTYYFEVFYAGASGVGAITSDGTTTTYATSSDYRLKENIQPMTGALAKVAALKPVTYTWKSTGETDEGFIAHELQEVCPSAVTGEKDAVDANGNPQYQGIDTSFLVATLTAAIQEQQAIIESLKARLDAANL
jgi:hypothetical protein